MNEQIVKKSYNDVNLSKDAQMVLKGILSKEMITKIKEKIDLNDPAFIKALKVYLSDDKQNGG